MIFVGDIANPDYYNIHELEEISKHFNDKFVVANLEGDLSDEHDNLNRNVVYNSSSTIPLLKKLNVKLVNLANNHIMDVEGYPSKTIKKLNKNSILTIGAGNNKNQASKPVEVKYRDVEYTFFSYGWQVIGCRKAGTSKPGVNLYQPKKNLEEIKVYKKYNPTKKVIVLMHWNYELEKYPQPMDRQFAHNLIDIGVEAIIGCHSHCVQGIEVYKDKPIVYSLGNWLFPNGYYFNKKLNFPEISNLELAFEMSNNKMVCHWFLKDENNKVNYLVSENLFTSLKNKDLTPFQSMTEKEYMTFFKNNRRKKSLLPIYESYNHSLQNAIKDKYIMVRHKGIRTALYLGLKKGPK